MPSNSSSPNKKLQPRSNGLDVVFRPARETSYVKRPESREQLEKSRLLQRHEKHTRLTEHQIQQPLSTESTTSYYASSAQQLDKPASLACDRAAVTLQAEQRQKQQHYMHQLETKQNRLNDWHDRHDRAAIAAKEKEDKRLHSAAHSEHAHKLNANSLPINPITLEYNSTRQAQLLQHEDNLVKFHAVQRMQRLQQRNNGTHNPITGVQNPTLLPPSKPQLAPQT